MDAVKKEISTWQDRVVATARIHRDYLHTDKNWTLKDTARELNRSTARISDDLSLAKWMNHPVHGAKVKKFESMTDALEFVRAKKLEEKLQ